MLGKVELAEPSKTTTEEKTIVNQLSTDEATIVNNEKRPYHLGSAQQQEYIDYAWDISHDPTFIYLIKAENGQISPDRKHGGYWRNGKLYYDYGFCGISNYYHKDTVNNEKFFSDWKWQMDKCYELYKGGTTFYGRNNIPKVKKFFEWK